ncbi:MAG TPA: glycosyltransferase family 9 protein [Opitutaceae bacterium]|nr:glycosyltransferase family 9 protein [Opitutaceae bacterium]
MLVRLLSALGWLVARTPERVLAGLAWGLGEAAYALLPRRRRLLRSNLDHAFPGRPRSWYARMARRSSRRVVETLLLSLATPHLPERRVRRIATLAPETERIFAGLAAQPRPTVIATLHLALWEAQTWLKFVGPAGVPEIGVIYRPLDHADLDAYVRATRERFGLRLLSRRDGFARAREILRARGAVGILFDQNAGERGCLTLLFGRVCSTTELPGLLAASFGAQLCTFWPRRTGFWRARFEMEVIAHDGTPAGATLALNRWLEARLAEDENACACWLWGHDRWRHQDVPTRRFRLESRRDLLAQDCSARGLSALPRRTRFWIRLPNWLGDVMMAAPLLRALRRSRPDAEITVFGRAGFAPLVAAWDFVDAFEPLPARGARYFAAFLRLRSRYPDVWFAFTNSFRGDLEGFLAGAPQRFGQARPGRPRPLLTDAYPAGPFAPGRHQFDEWEACFRHFGLSGTVSRLPLAPGTPAAPDGPIGLIPGSENNPEKRWPVAHWRELIARLPAERFVLFGTAADQPIAAAIAAGLPASAVTDLSGKTDLAEYAGRLRGCRCLIGNDTGGLHLANALGVPVIGLFGPTNPLRTGPVYAAPRLLVQPPGCPPTGGAPLGALAPECVLTALRALGETPA